MAASRMEDPIMFAIVRVRRVVVTPAAAPDSDAEAHMMKRTKSHTLVKLNMSFSSVDPSPMRKNEQKKPRNNVERQSITGPAHKMNPLEHESYTFKHDRSHPFGKTSSSCGWTE
mmetsp:Transcript_28102/g.53054  ORF Transcript_28102/g.53054 Transcript_28102/m.53054 type:complete len:114 (+) Transcript_28102:51-392(+)